MEQQILVLAPHPDDETFGCGGTLKLLTLSGARVDVVFMTRGEQGVEIPEVVCADIQKNLAETRTQEATAACRILGVREVLFLDGKDGEVSFQDHLQAPIREILHRTPYRRIFCPGPQEKHPDHQATFKHLVRALQGFPGAVDIWLYEVWTPLQPNMLMPIDSVMETKTQAMKAHRSQLACLDYLNAFQGLAAYRALSCPPSQFAEAFLVSPHQHIRPVS